MGRQDFISDAPPSAGRRDLLIIGIAVLTVLALFGLGNFLVGGVREKIAHLAEMHGGFMSAVLLVNLAATIYGWRRYREAMREVAARTASEKRAQSLASADPLTGFLNRRTMAEEAADLIARAQARRQAVAMLVLNLDGFKTVNDLHGHLTGDNLLRTAAGVIAGGLPVGAVTARLGADQFAAAFACNPGDTAAARRLVSGIVERLSQPFDLAGVHTHVSASAGASLSDAHCAEVDALMRRADIAMHAARKCGRGRSAWFDSSMQTELDKRNTVETGLRSAIPAGEIVPFFEQQVELASGALNGFEMLARWRHPERGLVPPDEFIAVAEECGLIGDLSLSVMRQALVEARGWDGSLTLSVNISPLQLKDPWLAQKIAKLLSETGFPAERLEIEITESSLLENLGLAQAIVGSLKNQGIRLALDDFGTGYSSLAHLRALPFDRIKIDRSFVGSIDSNPESAVVVTAITRLAESLNLKVTAEGIEDAAVEARLREVGAAYDGQGWHFGKPMPAAEVRALLARRNLLPATRGYQLHAVGSGTEARISRIA